MLTRFKLASTPLLRQGVTVSNRLFLKKNQGGKKENSETAEAAQEAPVAKDPAKEFFERSQKA